MPSIGHIAVGVAAGRKQWGAGLPPWQWALWYVALSCAADLDFGLVMLGVPHDSLYGHRGVSHSLAVALAVALAAAWAGRRFGQPMLRGFALGFAVYTSHIVVDCLNVGATGVPWFWPVTSAYYGFGWHPIPAVKTAADFLTPAAIPVLLAELVIFAPFWVYGLVRWRPGRRQAVPPRVPSLRPGAAELGRAAEAVSPWRRRRGARLEPPGTKNGRPAASR